MAEPNTVTLTLTIEQADKLARYAEAASHEASFLPMARGDNSLLAAEIRRQMKKIVQGLVPSHGSINTD